MIYIQLIYNLSMLIALSVLSGFVGKKEKIDEKQKSILQGIIFGMVAVVGMLFPVNYAPGLIFDGRSVVISLCALFFGPVSAIISAALPAVLRVFQGGVGTLPGVLVIVESALLGLLFHYLVYKKKNTVPIHILLLMGLFVHITMVLLMLTLPSDIAWDVVKSIGLPVISIYPAATILIGKIISDNLEKHRYLASLKVSEEKYRMLIENQTDLVVKVDNDGKFLYASPSYCKTFGKTEKELTGNTFFPLVHEEDIESTKKEMEKLNSPPHTCYIEQRAMTKDGWRWFGWTDTAELNKKNEVTAIIGVGRDITEKKQAEIDLNEKIVQYHNLANSSSALIWTSGTDKLCNYFNDTWLKFTGRNIEQEKGNGWAEGVHPDDYDRCLKTYVTAFDKREEFEMEYRLRNSKGEYRWLLDIGTPNYDAKGEFVGYIGHCFDIDDKIKSEAEQKEKDEEMRQMNSLMIGREIKMKELKEEINRLLKELGREPKY